jgi:hypothetical protein
VAFRERQRLCALCRVPLEPQWVGVGAERVEVDACKRCDGVFIEYFDGEASAIARALGPAHGEVGPLPHAGTCSDCGAPMALHRYVGNGPFLLRCESCLAIFATPAMLEELAAYGLPLEPNAKNSGLLALLRRVFHARARK